MALKFIIYNPLKMPPHKKACCAHAPKHLAIMVLILLAIFGLGLLTGYALFAEKTAPSTDVVVETEESLTDMVSEEIALSEEVSLASILIDDENIYHHEKSAYIVEVPEGWTVSEPAENITYFTSALRAADTNEDKKTFDIMISVTPTGLTLDDWRKENASGMNLFQRVDTFLDDEPAYKFQKTNEGAYVLISKFNENIYLLQISDHNSPNEIEQSLIDSFKFL